MVMQLAVEGESYHKTCFKCSHGGCILTPSSYAALDGILYCKHHFAQLFKEKGSYNHLIKAAAIKKNNAAAAAAAAAAVTEAAPEVMQN
jgi:cysteine and glycine-rich protein